MKPMQAACLATMLALTAGACSTGPAAEAPSSPILACDAPLEPWTQIELYFGRSLEGDDVVTEEMWQAFLSDTVTARFPDGLSVADIRGQWRNDQNVIIREPSKLLIVLVPDAPAAQGKVAEIVAAYKERFAQESVLHTQRPACVAF